jgi:two-component system, LuxR family, response regulator FixJ
MPGEVNVYVIDDDDAMRDSLDFLLGAAGFRVHLFETAGAFLAALPVAAPGCVVTDIRMPGMDGLELLKRLKGDRVALPVVVMTGHGDVPLAVDAMKLGAADFVEKPFDDERLIGAIRACVSGAGEAMKGEAPSKVAAARVASLSGRERQVMEGLVAGLSNKIIARDHGISPRTVEVYRANVMTKMQAANLSELVQLAMRAGVLRN